MRVIPSLVGAALLAAWFVPGPAFADDDGRVSWSPDAVAVEVVAGGAQSAEVEITAETAVTGAKLRVSAALRPFLSAAPQNLGALSAGERRAVTLTFAVPAGTAAGAIAGRVRARASDDDDEDEDELEGIPSSLPVTLTILSAPPLPPDPGEAGKATLEGIDADGDGVRDDVQRYIAFTFPNSARVRAAAGSYAQKVQETFFIGEDRTRAVNSAAAIQRASECFYFVSNTETFEDWQRTRRSKEALGAQVLDTPDRSRAYLAYDAQLAGGVFPVLPESEWKKGCAFDPDALPN